MTSIFLVAFIIGLVLGVRAMLYGVERGGGDAFRLDPNQIGRAPATPASPQVRWTEPLLAAFLTGAGVTGYVVLRRGMGLGAAVAVAVGVGAVLALATSRLVRKAQAFVPEHDPDDPRYVLQGHVARVTAPIAGTDQGEIAYTVEGASHVARARTLDGAPAEAGTEVVIERIEDGVAWVEPWSEVEQRL
jgi:membrane protein implicated in regulation of membrane protease activity